MFMPWTINRSRPKVSNSVMKIGPLTTRLIRSRCVAYPRTNSTAAEMNMPKNGSSPIHWFISQPT